MQREEIAFELPDSATHQAEARLIRSAAGTSGTRLRGLDQSSRLSMLAAKASIPEEKPSATEEWRSGRRA